MATLIQWISFSFLYTHTHPRARCGDIVPLSVFDPRLVWPLTLTLLWASLKTTQPFNTSGWCLCVHMVCMSLSMCVFALMSVKVFSLFLHGSLQHDLLIDVEILDLSEHMPASELPWTTFSTIQFNFLFTWIIDFIWQLFVINYDGRPPKLPWCWQCSR